MFSIRNSRTRLVGAAATVVLAGLSLTACGSTSGTRTDGSGTANSTASSSGASSGASPSASSSTGSTGSGSSTGSTGSTGAKPPVSVPSSAPAGAATPVASVGSKPVANTAATRAPAASSKPVTCDGSNTKTVAAPLNRPLNHMLLTVTNTGSRTCYLYAYPALRFSGAQAVPPVIEASHPQAVTTLQPGESGYASVALSAADGSGSNGRTVKSLTVYFYGRSGNESVRASAHPPLPAHGLYIDDSLKTTYWQQSMDDALTW